MKNSLLWRFIVIIVVTSLAALIVHMFPLKLGIDLAGGSQLLYELDQSKLDAHDRANLGELSARVIEVLKKRVDPLGQKNIIWRVVGQKRIQIQMPQADKATSDAMLAQDKAWEALDASALKLSTVTAAIHKTGPEREAAIKALAPEGSDANKAIHALAVAADRQDAVQKKLATADPGKVPTELLDEEYEAQKQYDDAVRALSVMNVDKAALRSVLTAADDPKLVEPQKLLAAMPAAYPRQKDQIEAVISAHKTLMSLSGGGGVDDPDELERLVTAAGVLDFRISVRPSALNNEDRQAALNSLQQYGLERPVTVNGSRAKWFLIDQNSLDNFRGDYFTGSWGIGETAILCYDDSFHTLTHSDPSRKPWATSAGSPEPDSRGSGLSLPFHMDAVGAKYMENLTGDNKGEPMAILLDNRAISAPIIQSVISDNGSITFGSPSPTHSIEAIRKEAEQLKQIMDAGSLPATLQKTPISKVKITSEFGEDNIRRGKNSAIYAVVAVMAFMLIYYTITGMFANVALMLNLLLVLASMAFIRGTFTLPGIAGLVLTLGMAVDANVLINERIREEIHKGASLWMAIKQGYDKVFWTIFDANLTCSLTSVVLIYVGSEEVKGFGVTLLIGLIIHMFTALFVTRTFMMAAVRWGLLKAIDDHSIGEYLKEIFTFTWLRNGHFPFMRVITVTNIDWIGKRHIFWAISGIITIAGLAAFIMRGEDKYDIEFRGGTQVTLKLHAEPDGHYLTLDDVRKRVDELADTRPELKDLHSARIYGVGLESEHSFDMQTTINNPPGQGDYVDKHLLDPLADKFKDVLELTPKVSFRGKTGADDEDKNVDVVKLEDEGLIRPITAPTLDKVFGKSDLNIPARDVSEYKGGCAVLIDNMEPPITAAELTRRISQARQSPSIDTPYRDFAIIPVTATTDDVLTAPAGTKWHTTEADSDDKRPLTRAVMVTVDNTNEYTPATENSWREIVPKAEWRILLRALEEGKRFPGVTTFDAVVASQAKQQAVLAIILSLVLIVIYVWIRFGGIWYGIGAIFSLAHDAIVALAATVLSGWIYSAVFNNHPNFLLISDFKINLTMIAAYLTIIGYSVNDTIVIFDRVRELRGRSTAPLSAKLINDAVNQCFGRTIWTTFTVFIVVLIMYVFGGEGVRGFSFAMLVGVITGAYSTLAIASPMLLTTARLHDRGATPGGTPAKKANPFLNKPELAPAPEPAPTVFKPHPQ